MINGEEAVGFNRMQTGLDGPDLIRVDDDNAKKELRLQQQLSNARLLQEKNNDEMCCRICLSEEEPENPIISPC